MKIAIIGGKLQGTEAAYLAEKAGIQTLLIDKRRNTIASGICDEFACFDVNDRDEKMIQLLKSVDFILPTIEDDQVLATLREISRENHFKLAFDYSAYAISSSKIKSDAIIRRNGVPSPCYYPNCEPPYIIKPSGESGSRGVVRVETKEEVENFLQSHQEGKWVIQEMLQGPSYSIEVIGVPGNYRTYAITEIHMDEVYDCKCVTSPCPITEEQIKQFEGMGVQLATMVNLHGIMDVEVIDDKGAFKVLEIDARLPSQTPAVVLYASGINLLKELADITCFGDFQDSNDRIERYSSYEHFIVSKDGIKESGEHIMGEAMPLSIRENFMGSDEVVSDFQEGRDTWYGIFINWADTQAELSRKRARTREMLQEHVKGLNK
jgi:pyrrolysine biosynthesis protein PylC